MTLLTFDFETYYAKDYSLSKMTTEAYVRDPRFQVIGFAYKVDNSPPIWVTGSDEEIRDALRSLEIHKHMLLCQNTAFDGFILSDRYGITAKFYLDTMCMAKPTDALTGCSLAQLGQKYLGMEKGHEVVLAMGKRREDFTPHELYQYGEYCKNDVAITHRLFHALKTNLPKQELKVIDLLLRMFIQPVIELDTPLLEEHLDDVVTKKAALLASVEDTVGKDALMSNPKFAEVLRSLGVEPPTKISLRTGKETYAFGKTDVGFKALLEHEDEAVQAVVAARLGVKSTLEETRTRAFISLSERGSLPILLNYYGAHTGRASGGDGVNLQNLPRGGALRKALRAPDGHMLVACDSAQIEARVVAWLSGQTDLVQAFAENRDIYSEFATRVYGYKVEKATHKIERHVGKTCILGLGYGMGAAKLQHSLKVGNPSVELSLDACKDIVKLYRETYRRIAAVWADSNLALHAIIKGARFYIGNNVVHTTETGIQLPNGMQISYPYLTKSPDVNRQADVFFYCSKRQQLAEWTKQKLVGEGWNPDAFTYVYGGKVTENVVQALARIVVFDQMIEIAKKYRVVLTVHDEVVCCVPEGDAEACKEYMIKCMSQPPEWGMDIPISCEADIGKTYGDAK